MLCVECFEPTTQHPLGRPRHYCSARCRVRHHRRVGKQDLPKDEPAGVAEPAQPASVDVPLFDAPSVTE